MFAIDPFVTVEEAQLTCASSTIPKMKIHTHISFIGIHAHESDFDHAKMQITRNILPIRPVRLDMGHQAIISLKLDRFGLYL